MPGVVALELVLARTAAVAVCVTRVAAYPTGFELEVVSFAPDGGEDLDPFFMARRRRPSGGDDDALRFGVQFSDGERATNLGSHRPPGLGGEPQGPILTSHGGGGGGGHWRQHFWIWPLPPPGPLALVCEWPAVSLPLTRHELDAQPIIAAASRAREIFPPGDEGGGARRTTYAPGARVLRSDFSER
ncbi:MAG TPA: hypothetical protein VHX66_18145 [Solirubrobacteraceae bacterium]|jgi:hypothetical protein|nr:hypothetical protein [Solirubrobacteraceae bacterium]